MKNQLNIKNQKNVVWIVLLISFIIISCTAASTDPVNTTTKCGDDVECEYSKLIGAWGTSTAVYTFSENNGSKNVDYNYKEGTSHYVLKNIGYANNTITGEIYTNDISSTHWGTIFILGVTAGAELKLQKKGSPAASPYSSVYTESEAKALVKPNSSCTSADSCYSYTKR